MQEEDCTLANIEKNATQMVNGCYKPDNDKKTNERAKTNISLNQAYTSGHVIQMPELEKKKKEEEARKKGQKQKAKEAKKLENQRQKELKK